MSWLLRLDSAAARAAGALPKRSGFWCAILRGMAIKKKQKPHTSAARKKGSASLSTSRRAKKAATKASKPATRSSLAKKKTQELKRRKKLEELTLKMFQMVYDDYQQGKFHRLL
jgi:hypothetical protein